MSKLELHGTTIVCVRKDGCVVIASDGQVSMGNQILKGTARKVRMIGKDVIAGFAGATADAITMFEMLDTRIKQNPGQLKKVCISLAKDWRPGKQMHNLEATLLVADINITLLLTGNGDVIEPEHHAIGIGSGGHYARAAARALLEETSIDTSNLTAYQIAMRAMSIAGDECVYTNHNIQFLQLPAKVHETV